MLVKVAQVAVHCALYIGTELPPVAWRVTVAMELCLRVAVYHLNVWIFQELDRLLVSN